MNVAEMIILCINKTRIRINIQLKVDDEKVNLQGVNADSKGDCGGIIYMHYMLIEVTSIVKNRFRGWTHAVSLWELAH